MKRQFPNLEIVLNGGLTTPEQGLTEAAALEEVKLDGLMYGRAAYHDPWMLTRIDAEIFGDDPAILWGSLQVSPVRGYGGALSVSKWRLSINPHRLFKWQQTPCARSTRRLNV